MPLPVTFVTAAPVIEPVVVIEKSVASTPVTLSEKVTVNVTLDAAVPFVVDQLLVVLAVTMELTVGAVASKERVSADDDRLTLPTLLVTVVVMDFEPSPPVKVTLVKV